MPLVRTLLHVLKSYAALALYSMFLLCLRSIWSMFSLYVGGEGRCMTVYMVSPWQRQNWRLAVFWINPSLCWKLCWQFLFHKLLHTSAFCLMVNNLNNSLIVWIQVWYICFTYSCNIKLCHVLGITALRVFCLQISLLLLLVLLRSLLDASSQTSSVVRIIFSSRNCIPGQVSFSTCIAL